MKLSDRANAMPPKLRVVFIVLGFAIVACLVIFLGVRKTITLSIDGQPHRVTTFSLRVTDLLASQGIAISPADELTPGLGTWLSNGATVSLVRAIPVQVLADGRLISILSPERVPATLLAESGVKANPADRLLSEGQAINPKDAFPPDTSAITLQLVRAVHFSLTVNGETHEITSTAPTLGSALWGAGYRLYAADELSPGASTPLTDGLVANLSPSRLVTIHTLAGDHSFRTAAQTVGQALADAQLSLQGLDYSIPAEDQPIPASAKLRVVRVTEQVLLEQTPLPFETEYQPDSDLEIDNQTVLQPGEAGMQAQRVRVRYEDGVEASRKVESEWVVREPANRIIGYGTAVIMHTTVVDGVQIQYWRALSMYATSYHPSEVGDTTASGMPLHKGIVAVDTRIVPLYTQLYIPGYGEAVAADIGGGVIGRWIDLGYDDGNYVAWHSWVTVYFLWPPPDNIVWIVP